MRRKALALLVLFLLVALPTAGQRSDSFFSLTTTKTFLPGEKISVRLYSHGVRTLEFRVYRVNDPLHFFGRLGDVHSFNFGGLGWRDPVVEAPTPLEQFHDWKMGIWHEIRDRFRAQYSAPSRSQTLAAQMNGEANRADIVVREIEVIPNGREPSMVLNGRLEPTAQHEVNFPEDSIPDASKIVVRLYPGPLSQVIEGMDGILRMPGGCFEQTSSSTYPNVLALDYMKRTKKLTPEVHAKAEGYIANGYQRLLTFEVPSGGFSWFGSPPANEILTAYGLMEFYDMSRVHDVDPKLIQRTQQWLAGQQQADGSWKPDASFINEGATNRYNSDVLRITAYIARSLETTDSHGLAVDKAKLALQALLKWGEASGTARKAATYITSKKDASGTWGTTQATIMALRALLLATEKSAADVRGTLEVRLTVKLPRNSS